MGVQKNPDAYDEELNELKETERDTIIKQRTEEILNHLENKLIDIRSTTEETNALKEQVGELNQNQNSRNARIMISEVH